MAPGWEVGQLTGPKTGALHGFPPGAGWRDLHPVHTWDGPGSKAPDYLPFVGGITMPVLRESKEQERHGTFHVNHDYRADSNIHIHVHWGSTNTHTGVCQFTIEWTYARMQQGAAPPFAFDAFLATSTLTIEQAGCGLVNGHQVAESVAFLPPNFDVDGLLHVRVARLGGQGLDTLTGDAWLYGFDVHHELGQIATHNRTRGDGWVY